MSDFSEQSYSQSQLIFNNNAAVAVSYTNASVIYYNIATANPGIFLEWERSGATGVSYYKIQKSPVFDGEYTTIAMVPFPYNEGVDSYGIPSDYYRIQEVNGTGTVLNTSSPIVGDELLMKTSLRYELEHLLHIPIYEEEVVFRKNRTMATVAFPYWNYSPRPDIRISGYSNEGDADPMIQLSETAPIYKTINAGYNPIVFNRDGFEQPYTNNNNYSDGLRCSYDYKGNIYFIDANGAPVSIQPYDTVFVSYNVKMFTTDHMNSALNMALQSINAQPGATKYPNVVNAPFYYEPALVYGAAYYMLRSVLVQLTNRQRRLLIEDPDAKFVEDLRSTATMYKEEFDKLLEKLPISRYPGIKSVVVPEFNMPGGRSRFFRYIWNIGSST
jgi:hypothetical protein